MFSKIVVLAMRSHWKPLNRLIHEKHEDDREILINKEKSVTEKGGGMLSGLTYAGEPPTGPFVLSLVAGVLILLGCSGRKRTSVLENVLGHTKSAAITVLNSYQDMQSVISPYPKNLE